MTPFGSDDTLLLYGSGQMKLFFDMLLRTPSAMYGEVLLLIFCINMVDFAGFVLIPFNSFFLFSILTLLQVECCIYLLGSLQTARAEVRRPRCAMCLLIPIRATSVSKSRNTILEFCHSFRTDGHLFLEGVPGIRK